MPDYVDAEQKLKKIQSDYKEEIERSKREFERQYINFILEQDHLSPSIVAKRQKELQLLMDNNVEFRDKVQSELETKRDSLLNPIKIKLLDIFFMLLNKFFDEIVNIIKPPTASNDVIDDRLYCIIGSVDIRK